MSKDKKQTTNANPLLATFAPIIDALELMPSFADPGNARVGDLVARLLYQVNYQLNGINENSSRFSYNGLVEDFTKRIEEHRENGTGDSPQATRDAYWYNANKAIKESLENLYEQLDELHVKFTGAKWEYDPNYTKSSKVGSAEPSSKMAEQLQGLFGDKTASAAAAA